MECRKQVNARPLDNGIVKTVHKLKMAFDIFQKPFLVCFCNQEIIPQRRI
jgi:hypothetical protein